MSFVPSFVHTYARFAQLNACLFAEFRRPVLQGQMHDAGDLFEFLMGEVHAACLSGPMRVMGASGKDDATDVKCSDGDACVTHAVFAYWVEKHMLCAACGTKTRVTRYNPQSFLVTTAQLRETPGTSFERALAQTHEVPLACLVEQGGCGAMNYERDELQTLSQLLVISKSRL